MALFRLSFLCVCVCVCVCFCSITFEVMHWFHSNFAELYITVRYRSSSILVIICQILAELLPFFNLVFVAVLILVSYQYFLHGCIDFIESVQKDIRDHCKLQVKFDITNHSQNFGWVMTLFRLSFCWCVDIGFHSITFAGMRWFYWKFAERYVIVKYRSSSILVIIRKILVPFSTWSPLGIGAIIGTSIFFCLFVFSFFLFFIYIKWLALKAGDTSDPRNSSRVISL